MTTEIEISKESAAVLPSVVSSALSMSSDEIKTSLLSVKSHYLEFAMKSEEPNTSLVMSNVDFLNLLLSALT